VIRNPVTVAVGRPGLGGYSVKNFRTFEISKNFYRLVEQLDWPSHLRDQALRAASSVVLNLAEGAGLPSKKQKSKHFGIALGSLREVQAALEINAVADTSKAMIVADQVAAHLYKLHRSVLS
jgi:four helix bundle protein